MKIAERLTQLPPYPFAELARLKAEAKTKGVDLIDLGIGDPDQPTPAHIVEAMQRAVKDSEMHQYDETGYGLPEFRQAVAEWFKKRFGVELDPEREILRINGAKDGMTQFLWAFINPGDIVLVPDPAYPVYKIGTILAGGNPFFFPLKPENGCLPDFEAIPQDVSQSAKLIFINYPNAPTTAVASLEFFEKVVSFAKRYGLILCNDAAYSEIYFEGEKPPSLLQVEGAKEVVIEFHSLSKTFNMTGWRIGYAVGNAELLSGLAKLKSNVDSGTFMAIQRAATAALRGPQDCVERMRQIYQKRRDIFVEGLNSLGWKMEKPKATFYVWAKVPEGYTSEGFAAKLLKEVGILLTPGAVYGQYGEGYVRISLTIKGKKPEAQLEESIERLRKIL